MSPHTHNDTIFPEVMTSPMSQVLNWSLDPLAYGSYSYVSKDSPGVGESDRAAVEAPIEDRVFFAGEALNPNYGSSVHAAYESGQRVATAVARARHRNVAILGAGMSGLSAAHALSQGGVRVTALEARERIGGRIWTDRGLGSALDLGATWIHGPQGNPLTTLAAQAKMELVITRDASIVRGERGRRISGLFLPGWIEEIAAQTTSGVASSELNPRYLATVFAKHGLGYKGADVQFPGGYDAIFTALRSDYEVILSSKVERVVRTTDGVELHGGGKTRTFDAVIVTMSLGVLKSGDIMFEPGLPQEKLGALERMGMGVLDKLYLRFDRVFWDRDITHIVTPETGLPQGQFNMWVNLHPYLNAPILLGFNAASAARSLSQKSDEEIVALAMGVLHRAYPV